MKGFSKQFNKVSKLAVKFHQEKKIFDEMIVDKYGFHYSDKDIDWIIDSIDYGGGGLTFKEFTRRMNEAKNDKTTN